jgi:hypothetical protein
MRINEQWQQLRSELEEQYKGITLQEYSSSWGGEKVRGPHVTLMIPSKQEAKCKCCQTKIEDTEILQPNKYQILTLKGIVKKYLCDVTWDGNIKHNDFRGSFEGKFYKIIFDQL